MERGHPVRHERKWGSSPTVREGVSLYKVNPEIEAAEFPSPWLFPLTTKRTPYCQETVKVIF
jgi:hypothetical protein